jgi:hypothetical protein
MLKEYYDTSKSKITFVICGVIIVLLLFFLCSDTSSHSSQKEFPLSPEEPLTSNFFQLQSSLYQEGDMLIGFIKSSDKATLKNAQATLKKYVEIIRTMDKGFVFLAERREDFPTIYRLLRASQPSFYDVWA